MAGWFLDGWMEGQWKVGLPNRALELEQVSDILTLGYIRCLQVSSLAAVAIVLCAHDSIHFQNRHLGASLSRNASQGMTIEYRILCHNTWPLSHWLRG
jgi:hypothetical protein